MGLSALAYILKLDGQVPAADIYDQKSVIYASYWMEKAKVICAIAVKLKFLIGLKTCFLVFGF